MYQRWIEQEIDEEENDFICKLFTRKEKEIDYLSKSHVNEKAEKTDGRVILYPEGILFGPYYHMPPGTFHLNLSIQMPSNIELPFCVTARDGTELISEYPVSSGMNTVSFEIAQSKERLEFVIRNTSNENVYIDSMTLS